MRRRVLAAGIAVAAGLLAATATTAGDAPPPLYGIAYQGSLGLVRVDTDTLQPLAGRRVPVAGEPLGWSFSPGRSRLALGSAGRGAALRLIDLTAMRVLGDVQIARRGSGVASAWAGATRVLAVVVTPGCCGEGDTIVAAVDAARRRVLWRRTLGGSLQHVDRFRRSLLLVLGPRGRSVGPSRLVRVGPDGRVRSAALPEIRSGSEPAGVVTQSWNPGLAVDISGGRAFVVQAQAPLAEVDLSTFQVRSHPFEPGARAADAVEGPTREALWLGRGLLAVTGFDSHHPEGAPTERRGWQTPAGLTLIDTRRWSARRINEGATDAVLVSGTLLASSAVRSGSGLSGYSLGGRRKFRLYRSDRIWGVQPLGRKALVAGRRGFTLLDARSGRELLRLRRLPLSLLSGAELFTY